MDCDHGYYTFIFVDFRSQNTPCIFLPYHIFFCLNSSIGSYLHCTFCYIYLLTDNISLCFANICLLDKFSHLILHCQLRPFSYTTQDHLSSVGTSYCDLGPPTSITNQKVPHRLAHRSLLSF